MIDPLELVKFHVVVAFSSIYYITTNRHLAEKKLEECKKIFYDRCYMHSFSLPRALID